MDEALARLAGTLTYVPLAWPRLLLMENVWEFYTIEGGRVWRQARALLEALPEYVWRVLRIDAVSDAGSVAERDRMWIVGVLLSAASEVERECIYTCVDIPQASVIEEIGQTGGLSPSDAALVTTSTVGTNGLASSVLRSAEDFAALLEAAGVAPAGTADGGAALGSVPMHM